MEQLRQRYRELTGKEPEKVMFLDNILHRGVMEEHIQRHFDRVFSQDGATIEEYLDFHRTREGLECDVLVMYGIQQYGAYFELKHINDDGVQAVLRDIPDGGELHVHLKGKDSEELARQLGDYFTTKKTELVGGKYRVGKKYPMEECVGMYVRVLNKLGLHARPAALFVQEASKYTGVEIKVTNEGGTRVEGKSIMGVMMLVASKGSKLLLEAKGPDAELALDNLYSLFQNKFGEE